MAEPRKLKFEVAFASAEDRDYPASELNYHSPETRGWQSPKFCEYPQEIGLRFVDGPVEVAQVQLLSHQSKIATRIELYIGHGADYYTSVFKRLGYLSLDSNERSNFKARELKSVYIQAKGSYLKLLIHKCHSNPHNLYSQVGLIAVNVLGTPLPAGTLIKPYASQQRPNKHKSSSGGKSNSKNNALGNLKVDMQLDTATAAILRDVHERKLAAVEEEDYELAKQYKTVEDSLKRIGGQLAEMMTEKAQAVKEEDYDRAAQLKHEIDRVRQQIQGQIEAIERGTLERYGGASHVAAPYNTATSAPPHGAEGPSGMLAADIHGSSGGYNMPRNRNIVGTTPSTYGPSHGASVQGTAAYGGYTGQEERFGYDNRSSYPPTMAQSNVSPGANSPPSHPSIPSNQQPGYNYASRATPPRHTEGGYSVESSVSPHQPQPSGGGAGGFGRPGPDSYLNRPLPGAGNHSIYEDAAMRHGTTSGAAMENPTQYSQQAYPPRPGSRPIRPAAEDVFTSAMDTNMDTNPIPENQQAQPPISGTANGGAVSASSLAPGKGGKADPSQLSGIDGIEDLPAPGPIRTADMKDAAPLIDVFGEYVVQCLYSKVWNLREVALQKIQLEIPNYSQPKSQIFDAVCHVVTRVTNMDRIAQVFVSSIQLLPVILDTCGTEMRRTEVHSKLDPVCSALVDKLADNQAKSRDAAVDALLELASRDNVGAPYIAHLCLKKLSKKQAAGWRAMHTRLMVLSMLVADHDLLHHGISPEQLIQFSVANKAHEHANGELREAAKQLVVEIYKVIGPAVEKHLGHLRRTQMDEYKAAFEIASNESGDEEQKQP